MRAVLVLLYPNAVIFIELLGERMRIQKGGVVTQISHRNSRKTKWFRSHSKMRPMPAGKQNKTMLDIFCGDI